jgi:uncharacterized membrane protein
MEPTTPSSAFPSPPPQAPPGSWPREPRRLAAGRGASWWGEGWKIFTAAPLPWLGILVMIVVVNVLLGMIPVVGGLAATVLGPIFAGGLLLGCHALANGQPLQFTHLFAAFQSDRLTPLAILGLVVLAFGVVVALAVGVLVFGAAGAALLTGAMSQGSGPGFAAAMAGMSGAALLGGLIALVVFAAFFMAWWFAPALVTLHRAPPIDALQASFRASVANLGAQLVFGLIFIGLAIVASIPFGLGWLVLGPVMIGASYASWREVFGD